MRAALLMLAALATAGARAQERPVVATEADLLRALLARSPAQALRAASDARAELARIARVTAPATSIVARHESIAGDLDGSAQVVGAGVSFELSRANALAREAAGLDAAAAMATAGEVALDAACAVRSLAGDIDALERRIRALDAERARISTLRADTERRAEAGEDAPFEADVLRAEESARQLEVPALRAAIASARAALESITGAETAGLTLDDAPALLSGEALHALVIERHPRLRALRARADAARSRTRLAGASNAARLDVFGGARTGHEPGASGDGFEVEVGVTLPSRSLRRSAVAEATVTERDVELDLARAERDVLRRLAAALASWQALDEARSRATPAGPLVEGALRRYRSGEGSLAEVIQVLTLDRARIVSDIELEASRRSARIEIDCASALLTAPALLQVLEGSTP